MPVNVPVSLGELWDKYTILLIKQNKISNKEKLQFVEKEITYLDTLMKDYSYKDDVLFINLKNVNEKLWDVEDKLRIKETEKNFDKEFIELARSVYYTNDERAAIKKQINVKFNSDIHEVKDYVKYK